MIMALNSTQVVAKAQAETRGNFHSIQVNSFYSRSHRLARFQNNSLTPTVMSLQVMLGFQHADLNFPAEFQQQQQQQQHHEDIHHDIPAHAPHPGSQVAMNNWPSCAQQANNISHQHATSVTSTTTSGSTGKKNEGKSSKKGSSNNDSGNTTKKKKTR
jgi:hypothetical protein